MSDAISVRENGFAEMAFTGSRSAIWHGLGQALPEDQTIEQWVVQAGMDWDVLEATSRFSYVDNLGCVITDDFPSKKTLFRSDNKSPLSIVGNDYKIVQPAQVLEFFRDLVANHDMKLSTAGVLFGGRRFWALADVGENFTLANGDRVESNLLLTTSVDGTLATTAKFVSTRVVCNNTLTVAMNEKTSMVKKTHRSIFDPSAFKIDLGIYENSWNEFMTNIKRMADTQVDDKIANQFFTELAINKKGEVSKLKVERLEGLYKNGAGAELSQDSVWGMLNAVTNMYTHGVNASKGDTSNKFWSSYNGVWENEKNKAYDKLVKEYVYA